jgi:hypothetical protein
MFFHKNYESRTEDKPTSETDNEKNYAVPKCVVNSQHNIEEEPKIRVGYSVHECRIDVIK